MDYGGWVMMEDGGRRMNAKLWRMVDGIWRLEDDRGKRMEDDV